MRLLIFAALAYLIYRGVKSWILKNTRPSNSSAVGRTTGEIDDVMVKDPYCEVYFPKRKGVHLSLKGEDLIFCSNECRDKFVAERTKPGK
jgi:YHS domain-containing protein